jgi:hypothetical protein
MEVWMDAETRALVEQVAEEAARRAVRETLLTLGIEADNPVEFQKDTAHLRAWRRRVEKIEEKAMISIILLFVTAVLGAAWIGFKVKLGL